MYLSHAHTRGELKPSGFWCIVWVCSHPAVVLSTDSPGRKASPSRAPAAALDSAALWPGNSRRQHSGGRGEAWSYTFLGLTDRKFFFFNFDFKSWGNEEMEWTVLHLAACSRRPSCPLVPVLSRSLQALNLPPRPAPSQGCCGWDPAQVDTWWTHAIDKLENDLKNMTGSSSPLKAHPVYATYIWVRRSTALLLTSLELVWALQPVQRYSTPCWLLRRTTEPLDLSPAQQQSTSNREPSSGSSPRTQNKRHSAQTDKKMSFKSQTQQVKQRQEDINMPLNDLHSWPPLASPCGWPGFPGKAAGNREAPSPEVPPPSETTTNKKAAAGGGLTMSACTVVLASATQHWHKH